MIAAALDTLPGTGLMTLAARSVSDEVMPDIADGDYTDWISQLDHYATKHGAIDKNLREILTSANHLHLTLPS